jgi:hypothetical protein
MRDSEVTQYVVTTIAVLIIIQLVLYQIEIAYIARLVQSNNLRKTDYEAFIKRLNSFAQEIHNNYDFYLSANRSWTSPVQVILAVILVAFLLIVLPEFASRSERTEIRVIYLCGWTFAVWMVFRTYRVVKITLDYNLSTSVD